MHDSLFPASDRPLPENWTREELVLIPSCLQLGARNYRRGEFIRLQGDPADFIGIVLSGSVRIVQEDLQGNRNVQASVGLGGMFAESFAFSSVSQLPVSIQAVSDSRILFLNRKKILEPCEKSCHIHQQLLLKFLTILSRKNRQLNDRLRHMSCRTTREKLLAYLTDQSLLHRSHSFEIPFDRQALADYLGVERSAMSAELGKLGREGILRTHRNHFELIRNEKEV